jgi:pimeloyl-ACP methyl ester carboxylesterase
MPVPIARAGARTFVLVAGAWHGAWCWERLRPLLEQRGHDVVTAELAGTADSTVDAAAASLEGWARSVAELCASRGEPVVLLGHSRGGVVVSRVAELIPDQVLRLVYLAAYLLPAGAQVAAAAREDTKSLVPANMLPAREGVTCVLRPEIIREAFYNDCDEHTAAWAMRRLKPEPLKPLVTPLRVSESRFGRVSRAYIECSRDRTIGIEAQRAMQARLPCEPTFTLDAGHCPFLSRPHELAELLVGL